MKRKKTQITIETVEVLVVRQHHSLSDRWCESCGKQVSVISASSTPGLSDEALRQQAETAWLHLIESAGEAEGDSPSLRTERE